MPDEQFLASLDAFRETSMEFDQVYALMAKACHLSYPEFWSLVLIQEGTVTQREISHALSLSRQTVNSAFKLLTGKGLIQLEEDPHDHRAKNARLTPKGLDFIARHILPSLELEGQAWATLDQVEQEQLLRLTHKYSMALYHLLMEQAKSDLNSSEDQ